MNKGILFLFPFLLHCSTSSACESDRDKKESRSNEEIELLCGKCDKYILTHTSPPLLKVLFWETIKSPSDVVLASDTSSLIAVQSLPSISCNSCKSVACEAVWHRTGTNLKAAYKLIAAHNKTR